MEPLWVDYHCHLDLYQDYEVQYAKCTEQRVATFAVTTTPRAWPRNKELASTSELVRVGIGIHPQLIGPNYRQELALFERYANETRFIGEVGLDSGPKHYKTIQEQKTVFEEVLKICAKSTGKILSIHVVRAHRDVIDMIETHLAGTSNHVVMHWFSGSDGDLRRCVELGCYFSVNQAMIESESAKPRIMAIPNERILVETDGPFTKTGFRPALPIDAALTTKSLGKLLSLGEEAAKQLIIENLRRIETR